MSQSFDRRTAYDLTIESQIVLPELQPIPSSNSLEIADVCIRLAPLRSKDLSELRQIDQWHWAGAKQLLFKIPDIGWFLVSNGCEILVDPEAGLDGESLRLYLLGSVFGALLFQRGLLVLHGNAVAVDSGCLVCVGESGAGKSTAAAAFFLRGHSLLSDDVVAVDSDGRAIPGFPRIKLWQDAADRFGIETADLRRIRPDMEKFSYPVTHGFAESRLPVRWIYLLEQHEGSEILLEPLKGAERFSVLLQHTYRSNFVSGMELQASHLRLCSQLSQQIRLMRVMRPIKQGHPDALIDAILADVATHRTV